MAPALLALACAFARPLPAPDDRLAQERATACIFYFRLQTLQVEGDSAGCEADGYGLEFMARHGAEVEALEHAHQAELDAQLARAHAVAAAMRQREAIRPACTQLFLDGGPGPDGGAELCTLAGLSHDVVLRIAIHDETLRQRAQAQRHRRWARGLGVGVAIGLVGLALSRIWIRIRRRR